ncbi:GerMN domain-containing protein [Iningainema tapete]|uniref:GerMN domain-containing protein n=1 Tax=Iningainema tapete BLCC-T55 TaxID=2748662 RepID=A0A8J6XG92_9CYAN|nr:GerMN domain-containing protein [Iningainema tapete]MBD2771942.1 GerMN domain-containing protein [Iningainema tapete BLCC-T55]
MKQQQSKGISNGVIAAVIAAVVAVSGGVAWLTWSSNKPVAQNPQPNISNSVEPSPKTNPVEKPAEVYWLQDTGTNFKLVPQPITIKPAGDSPNQILEAAFQTLLAGPTEATNSTTIPQGTKLVGVEVENDSVTVNLSEEFKSGGGSASMTGRVGQVVYTATALNPNAKVYIEVNGEKLEVLGGEGLELEQPLTRDSFNQNYPL